MKTLTHASLLVLSLAPLSQASNTAPEHIHKSITPPSGSGSPTYGRTLTGDFDGDGNPDVLYQRGTVWDVAIGVGVYEARMESLDSPLDCDVMRHQDGDRWLTLGATGLELRRMQFLQPSNFWIWAGGSSGSSGWAGASRVRVWSDDGLEHFVVGLNASSSAILVEKCNLSDIGDTATWSAFASIPISQTEPAVGIELFDHDGDGTPELAVRRANRLDVYLIGNGARVAFLPEGAGWSAACSTPIKHAGDAHEWLALVSNSTTPGLQRVATFGLEGVRNPRLLTGQALHAMVAADVSGDGLDDLVWSSSTHYDLIVQTNTGGVPVNGYSGPVYLAVSQYLVKYPIEPVTLDMLPNRGTPWVSDFNVDGDIDVGLPVLGASELWGKRTENSSSGQLAPTLVVYPREDDEHSPGDVGIWVNSSSRRLDFDVSIPPVRDGTWWDTTKYFLEMSLWSQADPNSSIESSPFTVRRVALPASAGLNVAAPSDLTAVPGNAVQCTPVACGEGVGFDRIVFLRVQIVRFRAGKYSAVTPGTMYVLYAQEQRTAYDDDTPNTPNGVAVDALLDQLPEGSARFIVISSNTSTLQLSGQLPPPVGKRVGLGGHVPTLTAPIDESPVGNTN